MVQCSVYLFLHDILIQQCVVYVTISYVQGVLLCFVTEVIPLGIPFTSHERLLL